MKFGNREIVFGFVVLFLGLVGGQWMLVLANAAELSASQHQREYELIDSQIAVACENDQHYSETKLRYLGDLDRQLSSRIARNFESLRATQKYIADPSREIRERRSRDLASANRIHRIAASNYEDSLVAAMGPKGSSKHWVGQLESRRMDLRKTRGEMELKQAEAKAPLPDLSRNVAQAIDRTKSLYAENRQYFQLQKKIESCVTWSMQNGPAEIAALVKRAGGATLSTDVDAGVYSGGGGRSSSAYSSSGSSSSSSDSGSAGAQ